MEVHAGRKPTRVEWPRGLVPPETVQALRDCVVSTEGLSHTPFGGGIRSLHVARCTHGSRVRRRAGRRRPWMRLNNPRLGKDFAVKVAIADAFLPQILLRPAEY